MLPFKQNQPKAAPEKSSYNIHMYVLCSGSITEMLYDQYNYNMFICNAGGKIS